MHEVGYKDAGNEYPAGRPPRTGKARWTLLALAIVSGVAAALFLWALPTKPAVQPVRQIAAVPVVVGTATVRDLPIWLAGIGTVTPLNTVDVKVRVDGQLQSVVFTEGQEVVTGQVLAQIDPRPFQAQLDQYKGQHARDSALLANARLDLTRYKDLVTKEVLAPQTLDSQVSLVRQYEGAVHSDQAQMEAARLQIEYSRITAPISGRVGMRRIDPGSIVHASDATGLVTVTQMAPISVLFSLPQDELETVAAGQHDGQLPVVVYTRDGERHIADGRLVSINNSVDQANGQIQLRAVFDNPNWELWPGEFISARVLVHTDRDATVVPAQAVLTGESGLYVYALNADHTVAARPVTVGPSVDGFTEIRTGVHSGDAVVLDGHSRLAPGTPVTVVPPVKPTPATTTGQAS